MEESTTVHGPSATEVGAYFKTLLSITGSDDTARYLTGIWLTQQMSGITSLITQGLGPARVWNDRDIANFIRKKREIDT